jgi:5-methylcytosine-specific restriction endonuclease McrA
MAKKWRDLVGKKTPPFKKYEEWTTARFWTFVRSSLRQAWNKWPPKYKVLNDAKRPAEYEWYNDEGRKLNVKWEYKCNNCNDYYMGKNVSVDHIIPVGSLKDYSDLPEFTERLFASEDELQVLCDECHDKKTLEERKK